MEEKRHSRTLVSGAPRTGAGEPSLGVVSGQTLPGGWADPGPYPSRRPTVGFDGLTQGKAIFSGGPISEEVCGYMCHTRTMQRSVSVRELRNTVSEVLRAVEGGERVTVTVDRRPVAELAPLVRRRVVTLDEARRIASAGMPQIAGSSAS